MSPRGLGPGSRLPAARYWGAAGRSLVGGVGRCEGVASVAGETGDGDGDAYSRAGAGLTSPAVPEATPSSGKAAVAMGLRGTATGGRSERFVASGGAVVVAVAASMLRTIITVDVVGATSFVEFFVAVICTETKKAKCSATANTTPTSGGRGERTNP